MYVMCRMLCHVPLCVMCYNISCVMCHYVSLCVMSSWVLNYLPFPGLSVEYRSGQVWNVYISVFLSECFKVSPTNIVNKLLFSKLLLWPKYKHISVLPSYLLCYILISFPIRKYKTSSRSSLSASPGASTRENFIWCEIFYQNGVNCQQPIFPPIRDNLIKFHQDIFPDNLVRADSSYKLL